MNRKGLVINSGSSEDISNGDIILKNLGKGTVMKLDDEWYEYLHISQILAVIKKI